MSNSIRINDDSKQAVDSVATEKEISAGEAADFLIGIAVTRRGALARYAEKQKELMTAGEKPKKAPKKAKKKAAKKGKKKAAKKGAKKSKKKESSVEEELTLN